MTITFLGRYYETRMRKDVRRGCIDTSIERYVFLRYAQEPESNRKVLLKQDMTIPDREAVMVVVELPWLGRGQAYHPAELYVFVQEGTILPRVRERRT
jgi:hypothetical protein